MATTLYQSNDGIIDFKAIGSLYSKTFDNIVKVREEVPREGAALFSQRMTNLETYKEGEVIGNLGLPFKNEDTDRIPLVSPLEGYNQTFTNVQYRLGFLLTRRAVRAQKTRLIETLLTGLPDTAARKEELAYASIFDNGFTSESGGDGSYLFATDHNHEDISAGAWANKASSGGAFTTDSYFAAWLNFQQREDARGFPMPQVPRRVVYPVALHEAVMKVRGSDKYPQNVLNAKMPELFGQFEPVPMHWLSSSAAWFVQGDTDDSKNGLVVVWETKPEYADLSDAMNPEIVMGRRLLMAFDVGVLHGRNWYGNAGA